MKRTGIWQDRGASIAGETGICIRFVNIDGRVSESVGNTAAFDALDEMDWQKRPSRKSDISEISALGLAFRSAALKGPAAWSLNCNSDLDEGNQFLLHLPHTDGFLQASWSPYSSISKLFASERMATVEDAARCVQGAEDIKPIYEVNGLLSVFSRLAMAEVIAWSAVEGVDEASNAALIQHMAKTAGSAAAIVGQLADHFADIQNVPTNIRILAAQLERGSGPIGVISTNHTTLSQELMTSVDDFRDAVRATCDEIDAVMLHSSCAQLVELAGKDTEGKLSPRLAQHLKETHREAMRMMFQSAFQITKATRRLEEVTTEMKRHVAGLDVTRIMCKIENARFKDRNSGLTEIIANLEVVQSEIAKCIRHAEQCCHGISAMAKRLGQEGAPSSEGLLQSARVRSARVPI